MSARAWLAAVLSLLAAMALPAEARTLHHPSRAKVQPRAFRSCAGLVGYARRHFAATHGVPEPTVTPVVEPGARAPGTPAPTATSAPQTSGGSATSTFSTTNNQEEGVDEPDVVKTDGSTIFALSNGKLIAVSVTGGGAPRVVDSLDLGSSGFGAQLLLRGHRLIVISGKQGPVPLPVAGGPAPGGRAAVVPPSPYGQTIVTEVDVSDPSAMKVARTVAIDGTFVDARQNGPSARLVISTAPRAIALPALRGSASGWVPQLRFKSSITGRHHVRPIARCQAISRPVQFSGLGTLTILTVDLDRGLFRTDSDSLMADARVVYGSTGSLYVATEKWINPAVAPDQVPASETTVIDRFDVTDPDRTTYRSSGEVPGYVLNQFSLSEDKGFLRVATTSRPIWWQGGPPQSQSQSFVTVLAERSGLLVPVGQVSGLGPGQQIYSVRFLGDVGYVVTFRQIDPLYTIDLSTPTAPRVAGQLELQGYSAYLHPVADGLLLGIGVDVSSNEPSGTQLELFDVSNPSAPKLLQRTALGGGSSSEVQYDHHAFLFWPPTKLAVLPVQVFSNQGGPQTEPPQQGGGGASPSPSPQESFVGAIGYHVDQSGIAEVGRVVHDQTNGFTPPIHRSIVIGSHLYTVSDGGVMESTLATLAREAFAPFPSG